MKITLTLVDMDFSDLQRVYTALGDLTVKLVSDDPRGAEPNAETVAALQESKAGNVTRVDSVSDIFGRSEEHDPLAALILETDDKYARTETVTIRAGKKGSAGSAVLTDDGREGVIEACYRGRAIVSFEDFSAELLGGSTLTLAPEGDEEAPDAVETEGEAEGEQEEDAESEAEDAAPAARRSRRAEKTGREKAQDLIEQIVKQDGGKESVLALLREFDSEATSLDALEDHEAEEIIPELQDMLA